MMRTPCLEGGGCRVPAADKNGLLQWRGAVLWTPLDGLPSLALSVWTPSGGHGEHGLRSLSLKWTPIERVDDSWMVSASCRVASSDMMYSLKVLIEERREPREPGQTRICTSARLQGLVSSKRWTSLVGPSEACDVTRLAEWSKYCLYIREAPA
eukprot:9191909-Pyramimonas_sp.AAC.1